MKNLFYINNHKIKNNFYFLAEGLVDITDAPTKKPNTVCQSFGSYFAEDSENCGAYYLCTNGEETKMTCPEKQLFNAETSLCSDFQTVFCGNRPVNHADKNQCIYLFKFLSFWFYLNLS